MEADAEKESSTPKNEDPNTERLLLSKEDGQELGKILETPAIAIEVERAVLQIGQKLKKAEEEAGEDQKKDV